MFVGIFYSRRLSFCPSVESVPVLLLVFSAKTNCPKLNANRSVSTILILLITVILLSLCQSGKLRGIVWERVPAVYTLNSVQATNVKLLLSHLWKRLICGLHARNGNNNL